MNNALLLSAFVSLVVIVAGCNGDSAEHAARSKQSSNSSANQSNTTGEVEGVGQQELAEIAVERLFQHPYALFSEYRPRIVGRAVARVRGNSLCVRPVLKRMVALEDMSQMDRINPRARGFELLTLIGPEAAEAVPELIAGLGTGDEDDVLADEQVILLMEQFSGQRVSRNEPPTPERPRVYAAAILALGQIGADAKPALPRLLELLDHERSLNFSGAWFINEDVKELAKQISPEFDRDYRRTHLHHMELFCWAAVRIDPTSEDLAKRLMSLIDSDDPWNRLPALSALAQMKSSSEIDAKLRGLVTDEVLSSRAVTALIDRSFNTGNGELRNELLTHSDEDVRDQATYEVFRHQTHANDVDQLLGGLVHELRAVRELAASRLVPLCQQSSELTLKLAAKVKDTYSTDTRRKFVLILDQLTELDAALTVPLIDLLNSRDTRTKELAQVLLARLGPTAEDAVVPLLEQQASYPLMCVAPTDSQVIALHRRLLGDRGELRVFPALGLSLLPDAEADVRKTLTAMSEDDELDGRLAELVLRRLKFDALTSDAERVAEAVLAEYIFWREMFWNEKPEQRSAQLLRMIQRRGTRDLVAPVAQVWLELEDPELMYLTLQMLESFAPHEPDCVKVVVPKLKSNNREEFTSARESLKSGNFALGPAVPLLIEMLEAAREGAVLPVSANDRFSSEDVCMLLAEAGRDAAPATELLIELASQERIDWGSAQQALVEIGKPAIPKLVGALGSSHSKRALFAAQVLDTHGREASEAIPALTDALQTRVGDVRKAVTDALGSMGPKAAEPVFQLTTQSRRNAVRYAAVDALCELGIHAIDELAKIAADTSLSYPREDAGFAGNIYQEALAQPRTQAIVALGVLGNAAERAVPTLAKVLREDDHVGVRHYVMQAIARIRPRSEEFVGALMSELNAPEAAERDKMKTN